MQPDLLVLGGGPAGIATSLLMAEKGYSVEVFDPAFFPRKKICGEFLNPQAVGWLQQQDLMASLLQLNPFPVYGMKIFDRGGQSFTGRYSSAQNVSGYAVMRCDFDSLMISEARKSSIIVHEGWKPKRLLFENDQVVGIAGTDANGEEFQKKGRMVVGADGRNNLIGRTFGLVRDIPGLRKYAFQGYFKNLPDLSNFGEVHLVPNGYVGIAPLTSSLANVALVVDEQAHPGGEPDLQSFLLHSIQNSRLNSRFYGLVPDTPVVTAGPLAFRVKKTSGRRTILVGDTCGFIDPFTGEGVNYAFISATLAAAVMDEAFRTNNFSDQQLGKYDRGRTQLFSRRFALARLLQKAIAWPGLAVFLIRRFARKLDLADTVVSAVGSAVPVESVWNLRFLLKVLTA